jgi:hypothetical protein
MLTWLVVFVGLNLWTKLQNLICFGEFVENVENLLYENCPFCFTRKILDGGNGDVATHQYHKHQACISFLVGNTLSISSVCIIYSILFPPLKMLCTCHVLCKPIRLCDLKICLCLLKCGLVLTYFSCDAQGGH